MPGELYSPNGGTVYRIRDVLGEGASGCVYLIICMTDGNVYALKKSGKDMLSRMMVCREVHILSSIAHQAVPAVKEWWEDDSGVYIVMTYFSGKTLKQLTDEWVYRRKAGFEPENVLPWVRQLIDLFEYLHANHIIYRDLKPSNIIISRDGRLSIIDFGAACDGKTDTEGPGVGTPGYAPPEQYSQSYPSGEWTDIYSFGVLVYYLLTGEDPAQNLFHFRDLNFCIPVEVSLNKREKFYRTRQIRRMNMLIKNCTYSDPRKRCDWKDVRRRLSCMTYEEMRKRSDSVRRFILSVMAVFFAVYLGIMGIYGKLDQAGYEKVLQQSEFAEAKEAEKLLFKAIGQNPEKPEAYLALYDVFMRDGTFSEDEWQKMQQILMINRESIINDTAEWVIFDYKMGMAVYLLSDEQIAESQASVWFQKVEQADMQNMNLGEYDGRKYIWQKRAEIFKRWSQVNVQSGLQKSNTEEVNRRFWHDIDVLVSDVFFEDEVTWELGIYDKILGRMMEELTTGVKKQIVSKRKVKKILDIIRSQAEAADAEAEMKVMINRILDKEEMLSKRLAAVR